MGRAFPPLRETLAVLPGRLSPRLAELAVRFGLEMPFVKAATMLEAALGTPVSHDTIRRLTLGAGRAWLQLELDLAERLERAAVDRSSPAVMVPEAQPIADPHPVQLSLDGAMVRVVGGDFAEVRTLVIGAIGADTTGAHLTELSYTSALVDAQTFQRHVLPELARRGVLEHDGPVVAVTDGALWIQELLDLHCPAAVRVLDSMHATSYLAEAAKAAFGPGIAQTAIWIDETRQRLRAGQFAEVIAALCALPPSPEQGRALTYLLPRRQMVDYPRFVANGWPIGSGAVESANKQIVERRLKQAGMQWARPHVTAMVGLRALDASDRWSAAWPRIVAAMRASARQETAHCRTLRHPAAAIPAVPAPGVLTTLPAPPAPAPVAAKPKTIVNGKPTADHPWKRSRRFPSPQS